jgi:hypothetical protein
MRQLRTARLPMSTLTYFRVAVWVPILLPLLLVALLHAMGAVRVDPSDPLLARLGARFGVLAGYGPPYVIFAGILSWMSRRRPTASFAREALWVGPLVFSVALASLNGLVGVLAWPHEAGPAVLVSSIMLVFALPIAYGFAVLIWVSHRLLRACRLVVD